ncbi:L-serine ammonia-lyase, iron-sulfur-dependent, subunit alpha [Parvibacter caecicola]|uniref:L-serine dehydratase n=1 Tax=Parvibacter caecicola TaxID=747645 RepID=A0A7W5D2W1_9ACTN|nr:L-serine ammonia-lyase, iron-sulfur-dependent, subunit alpha [Parvibacter caecicola]MBB3171426.1 L-serine dehydratase [Parvibacter caecicola]MCR2042247.1 L-serine ammonia-lyase, iron-sulfur-dependent, subunit alpha [Parvibacter caecicola]RNL11197.1 serine dehydratase [Parvibacter caecicola]
MTTYGIRDVIGPFMVGPSSSHTAGALRIALMTRRLLGAEPVEAVFKLYGSFAHTYHGHGTDRALVAGLLGLAPDDLRVRDSFQLAKEAGLAFSFHPDDKTQTPHPNTVDIRVKDASGAVTEIRGESIGGGAAQITAINGVDVLLTGQYHSLVVKQKDVRGVLAFIAACVAEMEVNIATTKLFRERKGDVAYTVMETDDPIPPAIGQMLAANPKILQVRIVPSDRSAESAAPISEQEALEEGLAPTGFGADLSAEEASLLFEAVDFKNGAQLLSFAEKEHLALSDAICRRERCLLASLGIAVDDTHRYLGEALQVMKASATGPLTDPKKSMGGLIGGEAQKLWQQMQKGDGFGDSLQTRAVMYAQAVLETNASMGRIVAAPTAGSAGVVPAVLMALQDVYHFTDEQLARGLANAGAIGMLIMENASVSGAEGGCQAEVGSASAMAASAAVELMGGTPAQCLEAAAIAIAGLLGLVCDPIGGLVEAPCQKRNATGAANALAAAQLALAGIDSYVGFDETVTAMYAVGRSLPFELRESALGGLAATPSACQLCGACAPGAQPCN